MTRRYMTRGALTALLALVFAAVGCANGDGEETAVNVASIESSGATTEEARSDSQSTNEENAPREQAEAPASGPDSECPCGGECDGSCARSGGCECGGGCARSGGSECDGNCGGCQRHDGERGRVASEGSGASDAHGGCPYAQARRARPASEGAGGCPYLQARENRVVSAGSCGAD